MVLGVGVVFAAYLGVRFFEVTEKRPFNKKLRRLSKRVSQKKRAPPLGGELASGHEETARHKRYVAVSGIAMGTAMGRYLYPPLTIVTFILLAYAAIPYLKQAETSLVKKRKIDGYVLYSIADMLMLWLGALVSAAIGIGLLHLSRFVLSSAKDRSKELVVDAFAMRPRHVWIFRDGAELQVQLDSVRRDDIVIVNTGEVIPVDGIITEGFASVDQQALTGESRPAEKFVGEKVFASTILISGRVRVQVEQSGQETTVAKISDIINNAIDFRSSSELKGEQWANGYTMPLMVVSAAVWPILGPAASVGVLYAHIANTIRVVAPLSTLNYLNIALREGILIKDGRVLEELKNLDTVVFDKTGTLTQEVPQVGRILLSDVEFSRDELLFYAAAAEYRSTHPIAKAILQKAEERNLLLPVIEESSYKIGYGVSVTVNGKLVLLGSRRFMEMNGLRVATEIEQAMETAYTEGHTAILIAIDGKVRGALELYTLARPEVTTVLRQLERIGVTHKVIISGDHERPTKALANTLGMDEYHSDVLPSDKAAIVEKLQREGRKVVFIGDGVNDVLAMKKADVSISLSGSTAIATDVARIVLLDGTLSHLPYLFRLSAGLHRNLRRSLVINVIPSTVALYGVLFQNFGILTSVLVSQSPLVLGVANAYIPFKEKREEIEGACVEIEHPDSAEKFQDVQATKERGWPLSSIHALRSWATYPGTLYRRYINSQKVSRSVDGPARGDAEG
ncbi:MAG: heavy metal translocating P-type ATPase [Thiohalocapsa sp.]